MAGDLLTGYGAYDPAEVIIQLGGYEPTGFAADTKVTISKANDLITPYSGTDGDVSLTINRDNLGTMTIHLQNTSTSNDVLAAFAAAGPDTGYVAFSVYFEDPVGGVLTTTGWIQTQPEYTNGSTMGVMSWVIGLMDARLQFSETAAAASSITALTID